MSVPEFPHEASDNHYLIPYAYEICDNTIYMTVEYVEGDARYLQSYDQDILDGSKRHPTILKTTVRYIVPRNEVQTNNVCEVIKYSYRKTALLDP